MQSKKDLELKWQQLQIEKKQLVAEQQKGGEAWTAEKQDRLDAVVEELIDLEEEIAALEVKEVAAGTKGKTEKYVPEPGSEGFYHVRMTKGKKKFDPETGEQFNFPFVQTFTKGEYKHFAEFGSALGYVDIEVLWDPTKNN